MVGRGNAGHGVARLGEAGMADTRAKALTYIRNGAVVILFARTRRTDRVPCEVVARVAGYTGRWIVDLTDNVWTCSCKATADDGQECGHAAAVKQVVGHPSAAAKPAKAAKASAAA